MKLSLLLAIFSIQQILTTTVRAQRWPPQSIQPQGIQPQAIQPQPYLPPGGYTPSQYPQYYPPVPEVTPSPPSKCWTTSLLSKLFKPITSRFKWLSWPINTLLRMIDSFLQSYVDSDDTPMPRIGGC